MTDRKTVRGWIAQNKDGSWTWWPKKPHLDKEGHWFAKYSTKDILSGTCATAHRIECSLKYDDYTKSLQRFTGRMWK